MEVIIGIFLGLNNLIAFVDPTGTDPGVYSNEATIIEVQANTFGSKHYVQVTSDGHVKTCCIDDLP